MTSILHNRVDDLLVLFRADEPVLQQHPLIDGAVVPSFADDVWDLSAAEGAMNIPPYAKVVKFSRFPTAAWALIARSVLMAQLNPNHPVLRSSQIHRSSVRGTDVRTAVELARVLGALSRWAEQHDLGPIPLWGERDGLAFVELPRGGEPPSDQTRLKRARALRALHVYRDLLPGGGLRDPFDGQALPKAVGYRQPDACTGPLVRREVFINHVNDIADSAGLQPIPAARVTTHMFRHTFAVIAADEPFAEIAVGWQLKHAANRILTTQAHLDREGTGWDRDIATEQTRSAIDALYESFTGYLDGGTIAGGGGARRAAFFNGIAGEVVERFPGQTGDDEIIKPFLRTAAQSFYPGTLNDCAFDASLARCLTSVAPSDRSAPVLSACQPGRCPNATIEEKHCPVWAAARGRLADLLERKHLSEPKRALLDAELAEVDRTISTIREPEPYGDR